MRVAGIDVSRNRFTVAILDQLPTVPLAVFAKKFKVFKFEATEINEFLSLDFDQAILEPTGEHYSKLVAARVAQSGRLVRWVGHAEIAAYRTSWKLPDKTDKTDAIALAAYGHDRGDMPNMFLDRRKEFSQVLREHFLETSFINKSTTPMINRLRQQLCHEIPEFAERKAERKWLGQPSGLWQAVAGHPSPKWEKEISESIGLGLSEFSRLLAKQIVGAEEMLQLLEIQAEPWFQDPELLPYLRAMEPFGFGKREQIAILSGIYPFSQFKGHRNPLGAFKKRLGLAQIWLESGEFKGWIPGGDGAIRSVLWYWARRTFPPAKSEHRAARLIQSPELEELRLYYLEGSTQEVTRDGVKTTEHFDPGKGSQRLMRCARRAMTMLFRKLVKAGLMEV